MSRFDYIRYDDQSAETSAAMKEQFERLEFMILGQLQKGRYQSLALTSLEEAFMWIGKQVRDDQIARTGASELQEERSNS